MILTAEDFADAYPITLTEQTRPEIERVCRRAESLAVRWCGWPVVDGAGFALAARTAYLDGPMVTDASRLSLPVPRIVAVTGIAVSPEWAYDAVSPVDLSTIAIDGSTIARRDPWPEGLRSIRVQYTAGLVRGDGYHDDALEALTSLARHLWERRTAAGIEQMSMQGQSVSRPAMGETIPRAIAHALASAGLVVWGSRLG